MTTLACLSLSPCLVYVYCFMVGFPWRTCVWQVLALLLCVRNMTLHAANFNFPRTQKYIVRILFVVPVYAVCSCIAVIAST